MVLNLGCITIRWEARAGLAQEEMDERNSSRKQQHRQRERKKTTTTAAATITATTRTDGDYGINKKKASE